MFKTTFRDQYLASEGVASNVNVVTILLDAIPGAIGVERSGKLDDRNGTDWWVNRGGNTDLSIDAKVRFKDYKPMGSDDLALETYSVMETQKPGWTRDSRKRTDYILWLWQDTGRWVIMPFPLLCSAMQRRWKQWIKAYRCAPQETTDGSREWHSECVFVPRMEVWREIYRVANGTIQIPNAKQPLLFDMP